MPNDDFEKDTRIIVVNHLGQMVYSSEVNRDQTISIGSNFQPGLFLVFLISKEVILASSRLVKID